MYGVCGPLDAANALKRLKKSHDRYVIGLYALQSICSI